jgi:hypothetical protein
MATSPSSSSAAIGTGLGAAITNGSAAQIAGSSVEAAGSVASSALTAVGVPAPIANLVSAIANILGPVISSFDGCGATCTQATAYANQAGAAMGSAFQTYMEAPVHYYSAQQIFLTLFNTIMSQLQTACSNPALGSAGRACIADNSPNACKWTASPGGWSQDVTGAWVYTYWGAAGSGTACWNPYTGIYDEVANDPTVVPDGTAVSGGPVTVGTNSTTFAAPVVVTPTPTGLGSILSSPTTSGAIEVGLLCVAILVALMVVKELIDNG